jgi:PIN domain nuclease of toxin-antitoxin system
MRPPLLLDTHILLWAAAEPERLPEAARLAINESANEVRFSVVTIWEVGIKTARGRSDFAVNAARLRLKMLESGFLEVPVTGAHAVAAARLPPVHKDPFDRMLIAQAAAEGAAFLTVDAPLARYGPPVRVVR